jgi:hypothetical protein
MRIYARILVVVVLLAGCARGGPERASVSGRVYVDGQPLETGSINFVRADGTGPTAGSAIEGGEFRVERSKGPLVGTNRVEIRGNRKSGRKVPNPMSPKDMMDELVEAIPAEFNSKSTLTWEIQSGHNTRDFEVPSTKNRAR